MLCSSGVYTQAVYLGHVGFVFSALIRFFILNNLKLKYNILRDYVEEDLEKGVGVVDDIEKKSSDPVFYVRRIPEIEGCWRVVIKFIF